jgi:hypothetical protein
MACRSDLALARHLIAETKVSLPLDYRYPAASRSYRPQDPRGGIGLRTGSTSGGGEILCGRTVPAVRCSWRTTVGTIPTGSLRSAGEETGMANPRWDRGRADAGLAAIFLSLDRLFGRHDHRYPLDT